MWDAKHVGKGKMRESSTGRSLFVKLTAPSEAAGSALSREGTALPSSTVPIKKRDDGRSRC